MYLLRRALQFGNKQDSDLAARLLRCCKQNFEATLLTVFYVSIKICVNKQYPYPKGFFMTFLVLSVVERSVCKQLEVGGRSSGPGSRQSLYYSK